MTPQAAWGNLLNDCAFSPAGAVGGQMRHPPDAAGAGRARGTRRGRGAPGAVTGRQAERVRTWLPSTPAILCRLIAVGRPAYRAGKDLSVLGWPGGAVRTTGGRVVAEVLVGRNDELAMIGAFVERAGTDGEALLLFGEPGAGKTVVLDATGEVAEQAGFLVLRAAGVEFEADLTFSGLHQVLLPLLGEFGRLSGVHRDALNAALGYAEGPPPDRLLVSTAALTVLRQASAATPVLVIVDDLPWLDRASAGVLGFVVRRLAGSRVGFLAASRPGEESFFERAGLPQHELAPLAEEAASALVGSHFPELALKVRQRVVAEAQGNPLALLELPAALSGPQRAAAEELPVVPPRPGGNDHGRFVPNSGYKRLKNRRDGRI
jgi:AAA ATPase domain